MSKSPHTTGQPSPTPPRPRKIIDHGRIGGEFKEGEPDVPAGGIIMGLTIALVMALIASGVAWLIVFIWVDILSMM